MRWIQLFSRLTCPKIGLTLILLPVDAHVLIKALIRSRVDVSSAVTRTGQIMNASRFTSGVACQAVFLIKTLKLMSSIPLCSLPMWWRVGTDLLLGSWGPAGGVGFVSAPTRVMSRSDILRPPGNKSGIFHEQLSTKPFLHANEHQTKVNWICAENSLAYEYSLCYRRWWRMRKMKLKWVWQKLLQCRQNVH